MKVFWVFHTKMFSYTRTFILLLLLAIVKFQVIHPKENLWEEKTVVTQGPSEFPFDFGQVLDDATNVMSKVVGKMLAKKRLLGFDANKWYW